MKTMFFAFYRKVYFVIFLLQISQSNARTVALRDVRRNLTGFYKCEVSADAPLFHTEIKSGLMIVVGTFLGYFFLPSL
jgi:hypothetical protein